MMMMTMMMMIRWHINITYLIFLYSTVSTLNPARRKNDTKRNKTNKNIEDERKKTGGRKEERKIIIVV